MTRGAIAATLIAILFVPPMTSLSVAEEKKAAPSAAEKAKPEGPKKATSEPGGAGGGGTTGQPTPQATAPQAIPDGPALNILIRRTLLTVNDANLSGNYTVLRDLAAPDFQTANDAKKLAEIFSKLRSSKIDLAPIVYFDPKLVRPPEIEKNGMLHLSGFIPTQPQQVNFDMLFQYVASRWRMFGIAINTSPAKAAATSPEKDKTQQK